MRLALGIVSSGSGALISSSEMPPEVLGSTLDPQGAFLHADPVRQTTLPTLALAVATAPIRTRPTLDPPTPRKPSICKGILVECRKCRLSDESEMWGSGRRAGSPGPRRVSDGDCLPADRETGGTRGPRSTDGYISPHWRSVPPTIPFEGSETDQKRE